MSKIFVSFPMKYKYIYAIERFGVMYINNNYMKGE